MKLSQRTLTILTNFAKINPSIVINKGNTLSTISNPKTIVARAKVEENFEKDFAIYELNRLLSVVSFLQDPEITLAENQLVLSNGSNKVNYTYADRSTIRAIPPSSDIPLKELTAEFTLLPEMFANADKGLRILGLPELAVIGEDGKLYLEALDTKNPSGDTYKIEAGETNKTFKAVFKRENLEIISSIPYSIKIDRRGITHFSSKEFDLEYYIMLEANESKL